MLRLCKNTVAGADPKRAKNKEQRLKTQSGQALPLIVGFSESFIWNKHSPR